MSIPGFATPEVTKQLIKQYPKIQYRELGRTHLVSGILGFGTYNCHDDNPDHMEALRMAMDRGCNLIDTASGYTNGNAETLIGKILNQLLVWEEREREELIVISKVGQIVGETLDQLKQKPTAFEEVIAVSTNESHSIHPEFIQNQLTLSLARMHLDCIDIYLLHNPEQYLIWAYHRNISLAQARKIFKQRLYAAFLQLEKLVADGLIRFYGISADTFTTPEDHPAHISIAEVWRIYEDVCLQLGKTSDEGHFAVVQTPFYQSDAEPIQTQRTNFSQFVQQKNIGLIINRPLNRRLTHHQIEHRLNEILHEFGLLRQSLAEQLSELGLPPQISLEGLLSMAFPINDFQDLILTARSTQAIKELEEAFFKTRLQTVLDALNPSEFSPLEQWLQEYLSKFHEFFDLLYQRNPATTEGNVLPNLQRVEERFPQLSKHTPSQKGLILPLLSMGVDAVVNGMRHPSYVDDSFGIFSENINLLQSQLIDSQDPSK